MQKGLGRGLEALLPTSKEDVEVERVSVDAGIENEIKISLIKPNPHQPRKHFDEETLNQLADSIKEHGILQPLVVSKEGNEYILIAGERRLRASKIAGLEKVPVIMRTTREQQKLELAIIENVQRADLNVLEEAASYRKMIDEFTMTQDEVAKKVGKSRSAVANALRLLTLPLEVKKGLREGKITEGHARTILALTNIEEQIALYNQIISGKLNVRQAEAKVKGGSKPKSEEISLELKELEGELVKSLGSKVKITKRGKGGKITIEYYSDEELDRIAGKLK